MTISLEFKKLNDQFVRITGLKDGLGGSYENAATVKATLKTKAGLDVPGFVDVTLSYLAASDGIYIGQVQETFDPVKGSYILFINAAQAGVVGHWELPAKVKVRNTID